MKALVKALAVTLMVMGLVGCQTTPIVAEESKPSEKIEEPKVLPQEPDELDKLEEQLKKEEKKDTKNPFEGKTIMPGQVVTSHKPVVCSRTDVLLNNLYQKFGEKPIFVGQVPSAMPNGMPVISMLTVTYNTDSETFTVLEQMPAEDRLMCVLAHGKGKLHQDIVKGTAL